MTANRPNLNCALWLRPDGIIGIDGERLTSWRDTSGRQVHALQPIAAHRPIIQEGFRAPHGERFVQFISEALGGPTVGRFFDLPDFCSSFAEGEIFAVLKADNDPSLATPAGASLWNFGTVGTLSDYPNPTGEIVETFGLAGTGGVGADPATDLTGWHLHNVRRDSDNLYVYLNDALLYANTEVGPASFTTSPSIGGNSIANTYWSGAIAEIIMFGRVINSNERDSIIQYLSDKYGLGIVAPAIIVDTWQSSWSNAEATDARQNLGWWTGKTGAVENEMADATDARSHRASIWY